MGRKLRQINRQLCDIQKDLECLVRLVAGLPAAIIAELRKPVGLEVDVGIPTNRPNTSEVTTMSKKCNVTLVKKSADRMNAATPGAKATGTAVVIRDNEDNTCTVFGVDAAGSRVDISTIATLTVSSDNTGVLTVDPPALTAFGFHGISVGNANINIVATWNDSSIGPFNLVLPATVGPGPVTGLDVTLGVPTSR